LPLAAAAHRFRARSRHASLRPAWQQAEFSDHIVQQCKTIMHVFVIDLHAGVKPATNREMPAHLFSTVRRIATRRQAFVWA
jgi:hypothetical protein